MDGLLKLRDEEQSTSNNAKNRQHTQQMMNKTKMHFLVAQNEKFILLPLYIIKFGKRNREKRNNQLS